ncbi:unnamed protein product [Lampetra planeri]
MGGRHWRGLHELGDQAEGKTYREDGERRGDAAGGSACASHASPRIRGVSWRQQRAAPSPTMSAPRERGVASEGT